MLMAVTATLLVNIFVATYEARRGRELGSPFLVADAAHTASDVVVTIGVLCSLLASHLGQTWSDPVAALLVLALGSHMGPMPLPYAMLTMLSDTLARSGSPLAERVIKALQDALGLKLNVGTESHFMGALGAALFALDHILLSRIPTAIKDTA